jgi:hypothetical protein
MSNTGFVPALRWLMAVSAMIAGVVLAAAGNAWAPHAFDWLADSATGAWLELVVPFLPMLFIAIGAVILPYRWP